MKRASLVLCGRRMTRTVQDNGKLIEHVLRWGFFRFVVRHYVPGGGLSSSLPFQARVAFFVGAPIWYRFCASEATALRLLTKQVRTLADSLNDLAKEAS